MNSKATLPKPSKQDMSISLLFLIFQSVIKSEMYERDALMLLMSMSCVLIPPKIEIGCIQPSHALMPIG